MLNLSCIIKELAGSEGVTNILKMAAILAHIPSKAEGRSALSLSAINILPPVAMNARVDTN